MPRSWTRTAALAMLFVALGAATTTGVAWGIALRHTNDRVGRASDALPRDRDTDRSAMFLPRRGQALVFSPPSDLLCVTSLYSSIEYVTDYDGHSISIDRGRGLGSHDLVVPEVMSAPSLRLVPVAPANTCLECRFGWPARALWLTSQQEDGGDEITFTKVDGLLCIPGRTPDTEFWASLGLQPEGQGFSCWLPIGILPLGFTLNTLFYAAAWFMCLFGISSTRRILRARRGLCTRCAYDLKGLPQGSPCPECGVGTSAVPTGLTPQSAAITEPSPHDE